METLEGERQIDAGPYCHLENSKRTSFEDERFTDPSSKGCLSSVDRSHFSVGDAVVFTGRERRQYIATIVDFRGDVVSVRCIGAKGLCRLSYMLLRKYEVPVQPG